MKKISKIKIIIYILLLMMVFLSCYPIVFLTVGSIKNQVELEQNLNAILQNTNGYASWSFLPRHPTIKFFIQLFLDSPSFFVMFWNSIKIVLGVLIGQLIVGVPAAWGFAKFNFPFKKILFLLYIALMMMPFQAIMLSEYLVLNKLSLMDSHWSLIFPGMFSTFPVFIMYNFFKSIPDAILESAKLDGANDFQMFILIGVPFGSSGIISAMVLNFLEYWNLVEQPLTFLKDKTLWPLSLFLPNISLERAGLAFVSSVITLIPSILVFFGGQDYLEQGIAATSVKE